MTTLSAIEVLAGIALIAFGIFDALEGDKPEGYGGRGWFRTSGGQGALLGWIYAAVGVCLLLHAIGVL